MNRMYFFFDTETTGVPRNYRAPVSDLANWPRLVQLAWVLADVDGREIDRAEYIVKPDGFTIPESVVKIHGITTRMALAKGLDLRCVLNCVRPVIERASVLVAHNVEFDQNILGAEFLRSAIPNPLLRKRSICTMKETSGFCRLPGPYGYKWPRLQELYVRLFDERFATAHNALADVQACARCYFELKRRGILR